MNKQEALDALELYHRNMEHILGPEDEKVKTIETCIQLVEEIPESNGGDTISRQAALNAMDTWDKFGCDPDGKLVRYDDDNHYVPYVHYDDMVHVIKHLPSAQPERKKGKWLITHDIGLTTAVCSECKYMIGHIEGCEYFRFCPSCGARLEVEDE